MVISEDNFIKYERKKYEPTSPIFKNSSLAAIALGTLSFSSRANPAVRRVEDCFPSTPDYYGEGPFYTPDPPDMVDGQLADPDEPGVRLIITGRVTNLDCTEFIPGTIIDVWHTDDAGQYDNQGYHLRGKTTSNTQGFYMFETIHPGKYLNGSSYRPSHIHIKITPPGFDTLTTQLYFAGDPYIESDAAASITQGQYDATHRIIELTTNNEGQEEGIWDIVIDGDGIVGKADIHTDKGMIYTTSPNPFRSSLNIDYGVFRNSKVSLLVFNIHGQLVANLEERQLQSGKYKATWNPQSSLPNGYYFIALKINEMQVHYQKVNLLR